MKPLPQVLILGRPNVGKSTFINRVLGKNKAITFDTPGVTRDLATFPTDWNGIDFLLVDSGGVFFAPSEDIYLQDKVEAMVRHAMEKAAKIIFLTDSRDGLHPIDESIAEVLRPYQDKVIVVVNKIDDPSKRFEVGEFYQLGLGTPLGISSVHGAGIGELLDNVVTGIEPHEIEDQTTFHVAIVGRPNVGKSSLVNAIINEERMIVDNQAGTTRDSVDVSFTHHGKEFVFIDTAGMRKKARVEDGIEYYSVLRSTQSIYRADLVIVVVEPDQLMCQQDKRIIQIVVKAKKNMMIFVNKWDLTPRTDEARQELIHKARQSMPVLEYFPFLFGSALMNLHLGRLFEMIPAIIETSQRRISTPQLNKFIEEVIKRNPPPAKYGERIKIYYATQPEINPPMFLFFVNKAEVIEKDYIRFVERRLRDFFQAFEGVPIQLFFRGRRKETE